MHYACLHILRKPCNQQTQISQIMESRFRHEPACGSKGIGEHWAEMFICATPNSPCCASPSKSPGNSGALLYHPYRATQSCNAESSKQDSTEPQLEPADEANCEPQHQRHQKFAPFPNAAKANSFNTCNCLGAQTHRFSKESKAVRGQVLLWNNLQHT